MSAKDYLPSKETGTKRPLEFWIREEETNTEIAQRCLDYIQGGALVEGLVRLEKTNERDADTARIQAFPFISYAIIN